MNAVRPLWMQAIAWNSDTRTCSAHRRHHEEADALRRFSVCGMTPGQPWIWRNSSCAYWRPDIPPGFRSTPRGRKPTAHLLGSTVRSGRGVEGVLDKYFGGGNLRRRRRIDALASDARIAADALVGSFSPPQHCRRGISAAGSVAPLFMIGRELQGIPPDVGEGLSSLPRWSSPPETLGAARATGRMVSQPATGGSRAGDFLRRERRIFAICYLVAERRSTTFTICWHRSALRFLAIAREKCRGHWWA